MTEKQKIFADEYLIDLNATRAYKVAYPRVKNDEVAAAAATRLLRNVKVAAYISERMQMECFLYQFRNALVQVLSSVVLGYQNPGYRKIRVQTLLHVSLRTRKQ